MGAWDSHPFDNDDALDWFAELEENGPEYIREAVATACQAAPEDYFDAYEGSITVAAVALTAAARKPELRAILHDDAIAWLDSSGFAPDAALVALCRKAMARVLGGNSELKDLWEDTEYYEQWCAEMKELKRALE